MTLWGISVALAVLVTLVVALLLWAILQQAQTILKVAADIWDGGTRIANNTVHVPDLARTNLFAGRLLERAPELHGHLERIREHAETCPGCPACVVRGAL